MPDDRKKKLLGATILVAVVAGLLGVGYLDLLAAPPPGEGPVTADAWVTDRHGTDLHRGTVTLDEANVLQALGAAAEAGNFSYTVTTYSFGAYVQAINGTEAQGESGWLFRVLRDGTWCWGDRAPDRYPLEDGDTVRWEWSGGYPQGCIEDEG